MGEFLLLSFHRDTARNYKYIYKQNNYKQQFFIKCVAPIIVFPFIKAQRVKYPLIV